VRQEDKGCIGASWLWLATAWRATACQVARVQDGRTGRRSQPGHDAGVLGRVDGLGGEGIVAGVAYTGTRARWPRAQPTCANAVAGTPPSKNAPVACDAGRQCAGRQARRHEGRHAWSVALKGRCTRQSPTLLPRVVLRRRALDHHHLVRPRPNRARQGGRAVRPSQPHNYRGGSRCVTRCTGWHGAEARRHHAGGLV